MKIASSKWHSELASSLLFFHLRMGEASVTVGLQFELMKSNWSAAAAEEEEEEEEDDDDDGDL